MEDRWPAAVRAAGAGNCPWKRWSLSGKCFPCCKGRWERARIDWAIEVDVAVVVAAAAIAVAVVVVGYVTWLKRKRWR